MAIEPDGLDSDVSVVFTTSGTDTISYTAVDPSLTINFPSLTHVSGYTEVNIKPLNDILLETNQVQR